MKKILISQPRYMPSYEFVRRLFLVDEFVMMDNTILDHRDYENRCLLSVSGTDKWLTIPTTKKQTIGATMITKDFEDEHERIIKEYYRRKEPIYRELIPEGERSYIKFMIGHYERMIRKFNIDCRITLASDYCDVSLKGKEEIIHILEKSGAKTYVSGQNCVNYGINHELLSEKGINLQLVSFKEESDKLLKNNGIDCKFSLLDTLNKGILTWQT